MRIYTSLHLRELLKQRLSGKRFFHSLMVEKAARELAILHGADWYQAALAGLLHDICRDDHPNRQREYLERWGYSLDREWLANPQIWHAPCGSLYLARELGISDRGVLRAARYHTTGRAGMTLLEKTVFVADAVSADRSYPGAEALRKVARHSLDEAMFLSLSHILEQVAKKGLPLVRESWEAYNEYSGKMSHL